MRTHSDLILHVDGGARGNPGPAAAGIVLRDSDGNSLLEGGYVLGHMTNNQAEYSALLLGLEAAQRRGAESLIIYSDSELMVRQIIGEYRVKSRDLKPLHEDVQRHLLSLCSWVIHHVAREENHRADQLVNRALDADEDVVEVELFDAVPGLTPRAVPAAAALGGEVGPSGGLVVTIQQPGTGNCPLGCDDDRGVVISETLLKALHDVAHRASHRPADSTPLTLRCPACGMRRRIDVWRPAPHPR